jgi:hypothetical protein
VSSFCPHGQDDEPAPDLLCAELALAGKVREVVEGRQGRPDDGVIGLGNSVLPRFGLPRSLPIRGT